MIADTVTLVALEENEAPRFGGVDLDAAVLPDRLLSRCDVASLREACDEGERVYVFPGIVMPCWGGHPSLVLSLYSALTPEEMWERCGIARMETARALLGHEALLTTDALADVAALEMRGRLEVALAFYSLRLGNAVAAHRARWCQATGSDTGWVAPVTPLVDLAQRRVQHTTCTGNTTLWLVPERPNLQQRMRMHLVRPHVELDPDSGRDAALAWIANSWWEPGPTPAALAEALPLLAEVLPAEIWEQAREDLGR